MLPALTVKRALAAAPTHGECFGEESPASLKSLCLWLAGKRPRHFTNLEKPQSLVQAPNVGFGLKLERCMLGAVVSGSFSYPWEVRDGSVFCCLQPCVPAGWPAQAARVWVVPSGAGWHLGCGMGSADSLAPDLPAVSPVLPDFLPLKCDACEQIFCTDHITYTQHQCTSAYKKVRGQGRLGPSLSAALPARSGYLAHTPESCRAAPGLSAGPTCAN